MGGGGEAGEYVIVVRSGEVFLEVLISALMNVSLINQVKNCWVS